MRRRRRILLIAILLLGCWSLIFAEPGRTGNELLLSFVGDIMAHNVNYTMGDYSLIYRAVERVLKADDLTFSNLEFPIDPTLPQYTYPQFNNHPSYVQAAIDSGIEVFSLANNHTNDQGILSIFRTLESAEMLRHRSGGKVHFSGVRRSTDKPFEPERLQFGNWTIGYLAVTQFQNLPLKDPYVLEVNYERREEVEEFLDWISTVTPGYDLFILSYHGGVEYARKPDPKKTLFFRRLLDAGVHIVHGHHPHVLQPVETVQINGLNRVILFSTGNFISGQGTRIDPLRPEDDWCYTGDSAIFTLKVVKTERGPTVVGVNSLLTTNLRTPAGHFIIEPLERLADTLLNEPWAAYFKRRRDIMRAFLEENSLFSRELCNQPK
jgi:hypothetical protein